MTKILQSLAALALVAAILIPADGVARSVIKGLCVAAAVNLTVAAARCKP